MADNVNIPAVGTGDTTPVIAADDIAGVKHQRVKVEWGVDGVVNDTSASNPLPVVQTGTPALPTGAATATGVAAVVTALGTPLQAGGNVVVTGTVPLPTGAATETTLAAVNTKLGSALPLPTGAATQTTLAAVLAKQPALGTAGSGSSDVITVQGNASGTPVPVSGTFTAAALPDITASYTISTVVNQAALTGLAGYSTLILEVSATSNTATGVTWGVQGTFDSGTTWDNIPAMSLASGVVTQGSSLSTGAGAQYVLQIAGYQQVRVFTGAIASGAYTVNVRVSTGIWNARTVNLSSGALQIGTVGLVAGSATVGAVNINSPGSIAAAVQNAITSVASNVISAGSYKTIMFRNLSTSAQSVFIGTSAVTATTGMEIKPGEFLSFGAGECPSNTIGAITASGTATLISQYVA